jgi:predicted negative regulator of RcsB-dependent stress response
MSDRQTVAGAYAKIEAHEDLCAERYSNIHDKLGELRDDAKNTGRLVVGVLLALLGWMAVQLWNGQAVNPPSKAQALATVVAAVPK